MLVLALTVGCDVDFAYLVPAAAGQVDLLRNAVPIEEALAGGELTDEQVAKLALIRDVRVYARDVIGLNVEDNYTTFYDSGDEPVAFNISASHKDAFEPYLWWFPIVGTVPYLGYFNLAGAEAKREELAAQDFDVFIYEIDAYSGLGIVPNPILSPMLKRSELDLIDTVIHELLHSTIWRASDTSFNESLATFFGRTGAQKYLAARYPDEPGRLAEAAQRSADTDRYRDFALALYNDVDAFYSSDLSSEAKIAGREAIYQGGRDRFTAEVLPLMNDPTRFEWAANLPTNNAFMLGIRRYNLDLGVFEGVFQATGEDWTASLELFRRSAEAAEPYEYLRDWLDSDPATKAGAGGAEPAPTSPSSPPSARRSARGRGCCARCRATTLLPAE